MADKATNSDQLLQNWRKVLDQLTPAIAGYFSPNACRPSLEGNGLKLTFWYTFHHDRAKENLKTLQPLVAEYMGKEVIEIVFDATARKTNTAPLRPAPTPTPKPIPYSPWRDPAVDDVVRQLKGKVVHISEVQALSEIGQ